jgi:hypothetical protein
MSFITTPLQALRLWEGDERRRLRRLPVSPDTGLDEPKRHGPVAIRAHPSGSPQFPDRRAFHHDNKRAGCTL